MKRLLCLVALGAILSGCMPLPVSLGLTGWSYLISGKGPTDHLISETVNRDCAVFRLVVGQKPCRPFNNGQQSHLWAALQSGETGVTAEQPDYDVLGRPSKIELIKPIFGPVKKQSSAVNNLPAWQKFIAPSVSALPDQAARPAVSALSSTGRQKLTNIAYEPIGQLSKRTLLPQVNRLKKKSLPAFEPTMSGVEMNSFADSSMAENDFMVEISAEFVPVSLNAPDFGSDLSWDKPVSIDVWPLPRPGSAMMDDVVLDPHQLVLGSLRDRSMADQLSSRFTSYLSHVVTVEIGGAKWHRVVIDADSIYLAKLLKRQVGQVDGRRPWITSHVRTKS